MKVAVIGAHGRVGEHVIKELKDKKHDSLAIAGVEEHSDNMEKRGASDFTVYNEESLDTILEGCEAVIFLNGLSPKSHTGKTVLVDHEVIQDSVKESEKQGIKRFVMLSPILANETIEGETSNIADRESADDKLKNSNLNYTIIRSGKLTDEPGSGKIQASESLNQPSAEISRDDLASVLVEALENEAAYRKVFEVSSGETPISEALKTL